MTYLVKNIESRTLPDLERQINDLTMPVVSVLAHTRVDREMREPYWITTLLLWWEDDE